MGGLFSGGDEEDEELKREREEQQREEQEKEKQLQAQEEQQIQGASSRFGKPLSGSTLFSVGKSQTLG